MTREKEKERKKNLNKEGKLLRKFGRRKEKKEVMRQSERERRERTGKRDTNEHR